MVFGYFIITLALVQYFIFKEGVFPLELIEGHDIFPLFLILMMIILPLILKFEYKIRYSQIIKEIDKTIEELSEEVKTKS